MRNIKILYFGYALQSAWFWLGTWIFYYMSYGGAPAVGILETVMIVSSIVFEVPTGAVSDIIGKKKALVLGYLLAGLGTIWMGFAPNLVHMALSLVTLVAGFAFQSGTFEAMIFDSLKVEQQEKRYSKILSRMMSIHLGVMAVAGAIGGYLYVLSPGLPYVLTGISMIGASVVSLWLTEPAIDTEKFSIKGYLKQTKDGFVHIFKTKEVKRITIALLLVSFFMVIMYEGMNDISAVAFGFNEIQLGYIAAVFTLISAGISYIHSKLAIKFTSKQILIGGFLIFTLSMIVSPWIGLLIGGVTILVRYILHPILLTEISSVLNNEIESRFRATALSSFSMLRSVPYALSMFGITVLSGIYTAQIVIAVLGCLLFLAVIYLSKVLSKSHSTRG